MVGGASTSPTLLNLYLLALALLGAALAALLLGLGLHVRQCIANGHSLACPDQTGQIAVEGMGGKCGLPLGNVLHIAAVREGNAAYLGHCLCIIGITLVKIAHAVQQNRIGMLGLYQKNMIIKSRLFNMLIFSSTF